MVHSTDLILYYMASQLRKKEKCGPCRYDSVYPLALPYVYQCSNQCELIYSEFGHWKQVDRRIYVIESRMESSSERDQNQIKILKIPYV